MAQPWRDVICYNTPKVLNQVLDRRELLMLEMMKASFDSKEIFHVWGTLLKIIGSFIDPAGETLPQMYLL